MNYQSPYLAFVGIVGALIWSLNFWHFFRVKMLFIPRAKVVNGRLVSRLFLFFWGLSAWGLISYSLMLPQKTLSFTNEKIEVNDIIFVVDVSRSMLAIDFPPNRLEVARKKILEFVELGPTDRIGIIIFSERAFTLLPLSTDLKLIKEMVAEIKVGFLGNGTNIGDALGLGVARASQSMTKNKVIILLTDGVSNVGSMTPLMAAKEAKEQGVKVYTIGIGGAEGANLPVGRDIFGQMRYQHLPGGSIDIETLKKIANITGGQAYVAEDESALSDVLKKIEQLERSEVEKKKNPIFKELYWDYLALGILLFLLSEFLRRFYLREVF